MRRVVRILALALFALSTTGTLSHAQIVDDGRVRALIEQNAELLESATALVHETNSIKARATLVTARDLHERSVALFARDAIGMAARVALRAREVIQQTIAIAKREARLEEEALKAIERATFRLDQARAALEETGSEPATPRRLVFEATGNLRHAREQMHEHRFETALRLADASTSLSLQALRMLRRDHPGAAAPDLLRDEMERTDRTLEALAEVRPTLPPALARLAQQAFDVQRQARASAEAHEPGRAREQTLAARELALRALRASGSAGEAEPGRIDAALDLTDEILARAREAAGNDERRRRLEEAHRAQKSARDALASGQLDAARVQTMRARELANSILTDDASIDPAALEAALMRSEEVIARLASALEGHSDDTARDMLDRARARQSDARQALADNDPRRALALTKVANQIARDGLRRLGDERP